jgi:hypothetical protein
MEATSANSVMMLITIRTSRFVHTATYITIITIITTTTTTTTTITTTATTTTTLIHNYHHQPRWRVHQPMHF